MAMIRFIPAPAGNAGTGDAVGLRMAVHPRACGERTHRQNRSNTACGSSPRLRGTRRQRVVSYLVRRFIPAPAGNAETASRRWPDGSVHPRACGERFLGDKRIEGSTGSSPRLRGTRLHGARRGYDLRFIPAPAGNAPPTITPDTSSSVHPRACGERLDAEPHAGAVVRFIPAPAGNAAPRQGGIADHAVHPRACGERTQVQLYRLQGVGSSPRLRGTPGALGITVAGSRFIPAPAGNALRLASRARKAGGSSPRLRGTQ